jgi:hypothetical protein
MEPKKHTLSLESDRDQAVLPPGYMALGKCDFTFLNFALFGGKVKQSCVQPSCSENVMM